MMIAGTAAVRALWGALFAVPVLMAGWVAPATRAAAEDRALIIGINRYPGLTDANQLHASLNDAELMRRFAIDHWGFGKSQVRMLRDEAATARGILDAIDDWLVAGTEPGDRALLFYSGHGAYLPDDNGDETTDGRDEILVPYDVGTGEWAGASRVASVRDDAIGERLDRLAGRDVMVLIDSCYSGTISRGITLSATTRGVLGDGAERPRFAVRTLALPQGRTRGLDGAKASGRHKEPAFVDERHAGVMVWTAAASTQLAFEDSRRTGPRQGFFTGAFVAGIAERRGDGDGNGRVTAPELLAHLRKESESFCDHVNREEPDRKPCRAGLTPTLEAPDAALGRDLVAWGRRSGGDQPAASPSPASEPTSVLPAQRIDGSVEITLLGRERRPTRRFTLREPLQVRVTSEKPGWLIVLDIRKDGSATQLFPSKCSFPDRNIRAHAPLTLPTPHYGCRFTATASGRGTIVAIVTKDNLAVDDLLARHKDLAVEPKEHGRTYLARIAAAMLRVWTADTRNRPVHWSLATAEYEIAE